MCGSRFDEDFSLQEMQQIVISEIQENCPTADQLIGQAFAIGQTAQALPQRFQSSMSSSNMIQV